MRKSLLLAVIAATLLCSCAGMQTEDVIWGAVDVATDVFIFRDL